jgi:hypothetical protein
MGGRPYWLDRCRRLAKDFEATIESMHGSLSPISGARPGSSRGLEHNDVHCVVPGPTRMLVPLVEVPAIAVFSVKKVVA